MKMRAKYEDAMRNVLDTFTGADGGADFMALRLLVEEMDRRARQGDRAAEATLEVLLRFSRLIDVARREADR